MADYSGALKKFRDSGYPKDTQGPDAQAQTPGVRTIKLTDEEVKELSAYATGPGEEQVCEVSGTLDGNTLRVISVGSPDSGADPMDANADAEQVMSKFRQGPITQSQTIPSPS